MSLVCVYCAAFLAAGVNLILVLDGPAPPCKADTNTGRSDLRNEQLDAARAATSCDARRKACAKAFTVSPKHTVALIAELRKNGLNYIVSPREADAQLQFLCKIGVADVVWADDSDIFVLGADIISQKTMSPGYGRMVRQCKLFASAELPSASDTGTGDQEKTVPERFLHVCRQHGFPGLLWYSVLAGNDVLSIYGIGAIKALAIVEAAFNAGETITVDTMLPRIREKQTAAGRAKQTDADLRFKMRVTLLALGGGALVHDPRLTKDATGRMLPGKQICALNAEQLRDWSDGDSDVVAQMGKPLASQAAHEHSLGYWPRGWEVGMTTSQGVVKFVNANTLLVQGAGQRPRQRWEGGGDSEGSSPALRPPPQTHTHG